MKLISAARSFLRLRVPFAHKAYLRFCDMTMARRFKRVYRTNHWKGKSCSGPGSDPEQTEVLKAELPAVFSDLGIASVLDVPCGDFAWMESITREVLNYVGADIVPEIVERNSRNFGSANRRFVVADITTDRLSAADLLLCRDCLVHLSNRLALLAIRNIKRSGSKYLLTTTFTIKRTNPDIPTGGWRPLDLTMPPFRLPKPLRLIDERCPIAEYDDKHLGLWRVSDLPDFD